MGIDMPANKMVTIVKTMIVLPCLPVSIACALAERASDRLACFGRRSIGSLSWKRLVAIKSKRRQICIRVQRLI